MQIDLTGPQRAALRSAFAPFADRIEQVGVYGSRARGNARPGSDVDLVVYGALSHQDVSAIAGLLEEGDLSIFADVVAYDHITSEPLKGEIDRWTRQLFSKRDLAAITAA